LGKLVNFDKQARAPRASQPAPTGNAQIYLFTGVRYERASVPPAPGKPAGSSRAKRKRG